MELELFRAANDSEAWTGACFTPDLWAAKSYLVGPFGNATDRVVYAYTANVYTEGSQVLEVETPDALADALEAHMAELGEDLAGMGVDGAEMLAAIRREYRVWDALESVAGVENAIQWAGYSWLAYPDNTPAEKVTTTWRYYGASDIEMTEAV